MPDGVRVLDDGVEQDQAGKGPARWLWVVVGFAVGLAAGVVFVAPAMTPPDTTLVEEEPGAPAAPGQPTEGVGVSRAVPDFPDALVAIAETETGSLEYILWPYATDVVVRSLPVGSTGEVKVDDSGRWIAATTVLPDNDRSMLSAGLTTGIKPLDSDVSSFSWSDTESGVLGYTRIDSDGWGLWSVSAVGEPKLVAAEGEPNAGEVAAWGDWGWVIAHPEVGGFDLLTSTGALRTRVEGTPLDSHQSGWILVAGDEGVTMVSAGGGVRAVPGFPRLVGDLGGAISPDGLKVAVLGTNGMGWGPLDGSVDPTLTQLGARVPQLSWSSDSRFVLVPGNRGVHVLDTETNTLRMVLPGHLIQWVGVIPLTPSS